MLDDAQLLQNIYHGAAMGRENVIDMMKMTQDADFRGVLSQQLSSYDSIASQASNLLRNLGYHHLELDPVIKISAQIEAMTKTINDHSVSKLSELMIEGSTQGLTRSIRNLRNYQGTDNEAFVLGTQLMNIEQSNIERMKRYL